MISFENGGKTYELDLSFRALYEYQVATGEKAFAAIEQLANLDAVRFAKLWQCACRPKLTEEQTVDLIASVGTVAAIALFHREIGVAFPAAEQQDASVPNLPASQPIAPPVN